MQETAYKPLTLLSCARLAAPHTWPGASVLPTVFGGLYSVWMGYTFHAALWVLLLVCATMAQAAVNTLNDWSDFKAGTDTIENSDDPTDAVMVYENPNPAHVLALGIFYMAVALASGLFCCFWADTALPIVIGVIGGITIVCYSSGKLPISYLPLGEFVSGFVMALIVLADITIFAAFSCDKGPLSFDIMTPIQWLNAVISMVPFILGIGLVMATQNGCDIERDKPIGRHTLAVVMGRQKFLWLYRILTVLWIAVVLHICFWSFKSGFWAACVVLVLGIGTIRGVLVTPLVHEVRGPSMGGINKANLFINGALCMAVMVCLMGL